jgi:hypothetical protein
MGTLSLSGGEPLLGVFVNMPRRRKAILAAAIPKLGSIG